MSEKELQEMIDFIKERGDDGCEFGEFIERFITLNGVTNSDYNPGGEDFEKAYHKEVKRTFDYLKENTRVVEETETITRTWKNVEWKGTDY